MEKPTTIKDKNALDYISFLEEKLKLYEDSPYVTTYLTIKNQIDDFNEQLTIGEKIDQFDNEGNKYSSQKGRIDIFGSKDDKEFDRAWKYMIDSFELHEQLEKFRNKMSEGEKKSVDEMLAKANFAEKGAMMKQNERKN